MYHGYNIPCIQSLLQLAKEPTPEIESKIKDEDYVDHTYRDYSQTKLEDLCPPGRPDLTPKQSPHLFPAILHRILDNPEYKKIIAWQPHGRTWTIWDKRLLVQDVLPAHFNHANFESFNRSVNGWGFKVGFMFIILTF